MGRSYKENPDKFKGRYHPKKKKNHKKWQNYEKPVDEPNDFPQEKWEFKIND